MGNVVAVVNAKAYESKNAHFGGESVFVLWNHTLLLFEQIVEIGHKVGVDVEERFVEIAVESLLLFANLVVVFQLSHHGVVLIVLGKLEQAVAIILEGIEIASATFEEQCNVLFLHAVGFHQMGVGFLQLVVHRLQVVVSLGEFRTRGGEFFVLLEHEANHTQESHHKQYEQNGE